MANFYWPTGTAYKQTDHDPRDSVVDGDWVRANWIDAYYSLKGAMQWHTGDDLVIQGQSCALKPVYAIADGVVTCSKDFTGQTWRNTVVIAHILPDGCHVSSRYAHLDTRLVSAGDTVKAGQQIGTVGNAFGALPYHLHFDIACGDVLQRIPDHWPGANKAGVDANYIDPLFLLTAHGAQDVPTPVVQPVTMYVTDDGLRLRSGPSTTYKILSLLSKGTAVVVDQNSVQNGFIHLVSGAGWLSLKFLTLTPPIIVPPFKPLDPGYGVQFLFGHYNRDVAQNMKYVKVISAPGALVDTHDLNPDPSRVLIHRTFYEGSIADYISQRGGTPESAADAWMIENAEALSRCPWAWHEGHNEQTQTDLEIAFEIARLTRLKKIGVKGIVLNRGVGWTSDELWKRSDMGKLLALVQETGSAVGVHCYGEGIISASSGDHYWKADGSWSVPGDPLPSKIDPVQSFLALRVVRDMQVVKDLGFNVQFMGTEVGCDDCGKPYPHGVQTRGWKSCIPIWQAEGWTTGSTESKFFLNSVDWWCRTTGIPGFIYAYGDDGTFDISGLF